jgi:hypothetical protein
MSLAVQLVFLPFVALLVLHPLALFVWVLRGLRDQPPVPAAGAWSRARADLREAAVITGCLLVASGMLCSFGALFRILVGWHEGSTEPGLATETSGR